MKGTDDDGEELRLPIVLDSLQGGVKQRTDAIKDLKILFDPNKSVNIGVLDDKAYHKIYELLFQVVLSEKATYLSAKAKVTNATAAARLTACADALRIVIKAGTPKLRVKTIEAIVDHITQTLPTADDEYCQPLSQHYLRALNIVFEHSPNVERLKKSIWFEVVDFCVHGLGKYLEDHDGEPSGLTRNSSGPGISHLSSSTARSSASTGRSSRRTSLSRQNVEDILRTLHLLVSASNAPIAERFHVVMDTIVRFLRILGTSVSHLHQLAFAVANAVLSYTCFDQTAFSQTVARSMLQEVSRFWQGKIIAREDEMLNGVRDEMLIFLFTVHPHLQQRVIEATDDILTNIEELSNILRSDYTRRADRDQLQLDDIELFDLQVGTYNTSPFSLEICQLKPHNGRAERNWAVLQAIGILERLLILGQRRSRLLEEERDLKQNSDLHPRKRQKITRSSDRLARSLHSEDEKSRFGALQAFPFIIRDCQLPVNELEEILNQLLSCAADKRGSISSWALLAIASCTFQESAAEIAPSHWTGGWLLGVKLLTHSSTCRAAALQLHSILARQLIEFHNIGEDVNAMIMAADISGPALLCDSAISLMMHLVNARIAEVPGTSLEASQYTIRWLFSRWTPADREFAVHHAAHVQPRHISNLLRTCLGLLPVDMTSSILPCGVLPQAWQRTLESQSVIDYLLLLNKSNTQEKKDESVCHSCPRSEASETITYTLSSSHFTSTRKLILELLSPRCTELSQSWKGYIMDRSSLVSIETFRSTVYGCLTMLLCLPHLSKAPLPQLRDFEARLQELYEDIISFLAEVEVRDLDTARSFTETLLQTLQPYLPVCSPDQLSQPSRTNPHLLSFFLLAVRDISKRGVILEPLGSEQLHDPMDLDDEFSTQQSHSKTDLHRVAVPRHVLALVRCPAAFYLTTFERLLLLEAISESLDSAGFVPSTFIDQIADLSDERLLLSRSFINEVLNSDLAIDLADTAKLLQRVGELISSTEFERCEVSLTLCLDVVISFGHHWSTQDPSNDLTSITNLAMDFYDHFYTGLTERALERQSMSTETQKGIAKLLFMSLRKPPNFETTLSLPSTRALLFDLIKMASIPVKFFIADRLPDLFRNYLLEDHDQAYIDLLPYLPSDPNSIEGISVRLYVLAKLASQWPSLLRRCLYALFETPGRIPESLDHSTRCLSEVSDSLKLESTQDLFDLFAPQLLYTWLSPHFDRPSRPKGRDIKEIPFQIFGFRSLRDLITRSQAEIVGLMTLLGQEDDVQYIAEILNIQTDDLFRMSFTKIMAYAIANDIRRPYLKEGQRGPLIVPKVQKRLGQNPFFELINAHFADIIALFFNTSDPSDADKSRKYFLKYDQQAADIMAEIVSTSASAIKLPTHQQPCFRDKFLFTQIECLCKWTEFEHRNIFQPVVVSFIARKLFETIHPALGPLHACSVLRKIRILISLAGSSAITGYPLEMLLQSVRPFIDDPQCADDAVGICQYLLDRGLTYLITRPSFVAGASLAILGSMRALLQKGRSSSTQESQYRATISKIQNFHEWLVSYLSKYDSPVLGVQTGEGFKTLIHSAHKSEWRGNAESGTPESGLLIQLLQDEQVNKKLLSKPSRELAFKTLCTEFQSPRSFRSDILGDDESAIENAVVVWKSCAGKSPGKEYLSWAGRVLGRAFAASGHVHEELLRESSLSDVTDLLPASQEVEISIACIINLLQDLTLGYNEVHAGLAEAALRLILTTSDEPIRETCERTLSEGLLMASLWSPLQAPPSDYLDGVKNDIQNDSYRPQAIFDKCWLRNLTLALVTSASDDILLFSLVPIIQRVESFAERAFQFIVHLVLSSPYHEKQVIKKDLSKAIMSWLKAADQVEQKKVRLLVNTLLYLRTQPYPKEKSSADRLQWLEIDYMRAADAATTCGMFKTALLFAEEYCSTPVKSSRRSSVNQNLEPSEIPNKMLLTIFENIDDPDSYYGVQQKANLGTILSRFEYEKDGPKSLAFRSAQYDSHFRQGGALDRDTQALVRALNNHSLSGLSHSLLLKAQQSAGMSANTLDSMFRTARKLERWDIPVPATSRNNSVTIYKTFQTIQTATNRDIILQALNDGLHCTMTGLMGQDLSASGLHDSLQTLAALVEMDEIFSTEGSEQIESMLSRFQDRSAWMKIGRFDDINQILSCRGTTLSTLSQKPSLQDLLDIPVVDTRLVEIRAALLASTLNRAHHALQESLSIATSLIDLIPACEEIALNVGVAIHVEAANALWDHEELSSSIGMLKDLDDAVSLNKQNISVGRSELLSKIGQRVSIARLEKADQIMDNYLKPAFKELRGKTSGPEAGQIFHQFAVFCDQQLQDTDTLEDIERLEKMSQGKRDEMARLDRLLKASTLQNEKSKLKRLHGQARSWLKIDEEELQRHILNRDQFLGQSLENYLLALTASDEHDNVALRFTALWLQHADEDIANQAVLKHLKHAPSRKFAPLMNQFAARLQDSEIKFQQLLSSLVTRICTDHPYHGMYTINAGINSRPKREDEAAVSRHDSAKKVARYLEVASKSAATWRAIVSTNKSYIILAGEKDDRYRSGRKVPIKESTGASHLSQSINKYRIPPPTMPIELAADLNYSKLPLMHKLEPVMSIASGVSSPKIITVVADNGSRFKQLVKGSQDDLRQDAIMEQVFEQVNALLKTSQATRQRNLKIRTYKVIPLTAVAGIMEFVADTMPLHDYLMPAHEKYYPKDLPGNQCRKEIGEAQTKSIEVRVAKYRQVTERFHPVMRYFFTENFTDPDEWFLKRLAYTRSTAAISMLGHVLGLGDRHGHNILLDARSGEVVHIDLGVAFEAGRILPVPELVPFRLTRDIVDGMGITKTEGVFRRCCEFTLEAMRKEADSIMAVLDVLRYDPLYSWSISPARLAKLQEGQSAALNVDAEKQKEAINEPGEADRVLNVVSKKLMKTLSVTATVNDLINQASDERNLAVLYSGWAAYA